MNDPVSAREALMIEAIGEAGSLIESVKGLTPALQNSVREIDRAEASLRRTLAAFENRMAATTEYAKTQTIQYIARHADDVAKKSRELQTRVMAESAQALFKTELGPVLQRLVMPMQQLVERLDRPWERWLIHAAVAATASATTWILAVHVWGK
jgi:hypothetical protein